MEISKSAASRYHESTKYDPKTIGQLPGAEFEAQPLPFKSYHTDRAVDLIPYLPPKLFPDAEEEHPRVGSESYDSDLGRLSRLLYFTYGATARRVWPGGHQIFRAAPSAGGLYPIEVYLATQEIDGAPDALHDYFVPNHQLVPVFDGGWIDELAEFGYGAFDPAEVRAVLLLTGVYPRSTWRYHERAYRRVLLDAGHVFGNVAAYAAEEGFEALPVSCFQDDALNGAFFFDPEEEHAQLLVAIVDQRRGLRAPTALGWRRDERGFEGTEGDSFMEYHRASSLSALATAIHRSSPIDADEADSRTPLEYEATLGECAMADLILERRSTRAFTGDGVSWEKLCRLLRAAYDGVRDQLVGAASVPLFQTPELLRTHVLVRDVEGLEPGVHELDVIDRSLNLTRPGNFERATLEFALGQELASEAAAIVVHSADLPHALETYGERVYRSLHLDAGVIGQLLNLAALHQGLGVSGIGGFFDERVNATLGLPREHGILYLTAIGSAATPE